MFKELKYEDGTVSLWGHFCFIDPIIGVVMKSKFMESIAGWEKACAVNYFAELTQGRVGARITGERFGYAKTYKDKRDLLEFTGTQFELLGYGKVEWVRIDCDAEVFIVRMASPYAKVWKETFGLSKHTVDYWNAAGWAACVEYILGKPVVCIETACIAQGKPYCEFVVKPKDKWDKNDPLVKVNSFLFEELKIDLPKLRV